MHKIGAYQETCESEWYAWVSPGTGIYIIILGIRIRSEGLAQVMKKRNASEYIIGRIQRYPRAILSSPG